MRGWILVGCCGLWLMGCMASKEPHSQERASALSSLPSASPQLKPELLQKAHPALSPKAGVKVAQYYESPRGILAIGAASEVHVTTHHPMVWGSARSACGLRLFLSATPASKPGYAHQPKAPRKGGWGSFLSKVELLDGTIFGRVGRQIPSQRIQVSEDGLAFSLGTHRTYVQTNSIKTKDGRSLQRALLSSFPEQQGATLLAQLVSCKEYTP